MAKKSFILLCNNYLENKQHCYYIVVLYNSGNNTISAFNNSMVNL